jgi:hypothetical protein
VIAREIYVLQQSGNPRDVYNYQMAAAQEELHGILDHRFGEIANSLHEFMQNNERQIGQERDAFYTPQIHQLEAEIQELIRQFIEMEGKTSDNTTILIKKDVAIAKLVQLSGRMHQKVNNGQSRSQAFNAWTEISTKKAVLVRTYRRIYLLAAAKRIFFRRWVRKMNRHRESRFHHEVKARFEREWRARASENGRIIEGLELELKAARAELEEKHQRLIEMQQRLRKAFMRGVVNLNLEAMDVFNGGQFMDLMKEVELNEAEHYDDEAALHQSDDDFFVEEVPNIAVTRHR